MKFFGTKAMAATLFTAAGLLVIGCEMKAPMSAEDLKPWIEFNMVPDGEPEMINKITALTVKLQEKRKLFPPQEGKILRGVHPKSHGCVAASFTVLKYIGSDYQVGLFAKPGTYKAMIRYSNASVLELADLKGGNGSRGMAIKVLGVNGPIILADGDARNQDFLMINTPEFAFANARDYLRLTRVLMAHPVGADPTPYFYPLKLIGLGLLDESLELKPLAGNEPTEIADMWNFYDANDAFTGFTKEDLNGTKLSAGVIGKIKGESVRNPLQIQYFSASPTRFGPGRVMKFSVAPVIRTEQTAFTKEDEKTMAPNYLAEALKETMTHKKGENKKPMEFAFMVQVVDAFQLKNSKDGWEDMIENAAKAWNEEEYPFVKVATITIPAVEEKENLDFVDACKSLRFTPWHALAAHEPLGGINRLRKPVYCVSGKFRPDGEDPEQALCTSAEYGQ